MTAQGLHSPGPPERSAPAAGRSTKRTRVRPAGTRSNTCEFLSRGFFSEAFGNRGAVFKIMLRFWKSEFRRVVVRYSKNAPRQSSGMLHTCVLGDICDDNRHAFARQPFSSGSARTRPAPSSYNCDFSKEFHSLNRESILF